MKKIFELSNTEIAILVGCIARSLEEMELAFPHSFLKEFKSDLMKLSEKLEGRAPVIESKDP